MKQQRDTFKKQKTISPVDGGLILQLREFHRCTTSTVMHQDYTFLSSFIAKTLVFHEKVGTNQCYVCVFYCRSLILEVNV